MHQASVATAVLNAAVAVLLLLPGAHSAEIVAAGSSFPNAFYQSVNLIYPLEESGDTISYASIGAGASMCRVLDPDTCGATVAEPRDIDFACGESLISAQKYLDYPDAQMYPTAAAAVVPIVNIPELGDKELVLDTEALAQIFRANITRWNDDRIKATQSSEVAALLPDAPIQVVVRSGSKGTTEVFKTALAGFEEQFRIQVGTSSSDVWSGVSVKTAASIGGLAGYVQSTLYTIGYVGIFDANQLGLQVPALSRGGSAPIRCTDESVLFTLFEGGMNFGSYGDDPAHLTVNLLLVDGTSAWPITSFTYLLLRKDTLRPGATCDTRKAVMAYWDWFYNSDAVSQIMQQFGFAPLPGALRDAVLGRLRTDLLCNGVQVYQPIVNPTVTSVAPLFMKNFFSRLVSPTYASINADMDILYSIDVGAPFSNSETIRLQRSGTADSGDASIKFPFGLYGVGVMYNLCGRDTCSLASAATVALSPSIIAGILTGEILKWNHPSMVALNPFLSVVDESITVYCAPAISTDMIALTSILQMSYPDFEINRDLVTTVDAAVVKSYLYANQYAFAVTALVQADLEGAARIADVVNSNGDVINPGESSYAACVDPRTPLACYPLTDTIVLATVPAYYGDCGQDGLPRQKVELVKWLLSSSTFVSAFGIYPLSTAGASLDASLEAITCNGKSIMRIEEDRTPIPASLTTGLRVIAGLTVFVMLLLAVGVFIFRASKSINNSQPEFMGVLLLGLIIMAMSIFFMGVEDDNSSSAFAGPDEACMEQVWFYAIGFSIVIASLVAKAARIKRILKNAADMKREKVHASQMVPLVAALVSVELVILTVWQIVSPLKFERVIDETDAETGDPTLSHGVCRSDEALPFLFVLLLVKVVVCMYGNIIAFQINQPGNSIGESRLLSMTMLSCVQSFIVAVPLCYLLRDDPSTLYVVKAMSVMFAIVVVSGVMIFSKFFDLSIQVAKVRRAKIHSSSNGGNGQNSSMVSSNDNPSVSMSVNPKLASIIETDDSVVHVYSSVEQKKGKKEEV